MDVTSLTLDRRKFLSTLGAAMALPGRARPAAPARPNIVLIYADDVGFGDLSCYGASRVRTPNLDRLATSGVRFTNLHATSATCTPSRYSLLTGEYAWRRPGTGVLPGDASLIVTPGKPTLPAMLRGAGYRTAAIGKWHLGLGTGNVDWNGEIRPGPLEVGFDECFILPATGDRVPCVFVENRRVFGLDPADPIRVSYQQPIPGQPTGKANPELLRLHPSHGHDQAIVNGVSRIGYMSGGNKALWVDEDIADVLTTRATQFIERNRANPFFLYLATHDIHVPRLPHRRFAGRTPMGARGDAIAELDWTVGEVLAALDRTATARNTLVVFSSDNGPVVDDGYRDEAVEKLGNHRPAGSLRGGKYSAFDGGTRVPAIARWPGQIRADSTSSALISQVDFYASLASLTGQTLGPDEAPDSFDLRQALLGRQRAGREWLVEHAGVLSLIEGNWKLILPGKGPRTNPYTNTELGNDSEPQLYDLSKDLGETTNLAAREPDRVERMVAHLERIRQTPRTRP